VGRLWVLVLVVVLVCSQGKIELLTNTWEVSFDKACALHVDVLGQRWKLLQWHVHNTEHTING
jgi:hypothetical protein